MELTLTPRLAAVARLVHQAAHLADVGTDHAYLPVRLLLDGRVEYAIAADLREGPLSRARETAARYGVEGRISFRLCDGLSGVGREEADTVAIAGMGGETIAAILAAAPWVREQGCLLLLQPMSAQPFLRRWLQAHGYTIRRELLSREGDTLYTTFEVYAGPMAKLTPAELWAGRQTRGEGSPLRLAYLDRLLRQTERAIAGLKRSKRPEDASRLAELEQVHQGLLDMKEEWLSWQR